MEDHRDNQYGDFVKSDDNSGGTAQDCTDRSRQTTGPPDLGAGLIRE
jgi:hypothetical protein